VVFFLYADYKGYKDLYKVKDFRSLCSYLEKNEMEHEPIFVFRNISADNMKFYYHGINILIPVPKAFSYNKTFDKEQWKLNEQNLNDLNKTLMRFSHFYVVIDNSPLNGVYESKTLLLDFLSKKFIFKEEKSFKGNILLYKSSGIMN
jgi:hypothetical protein